jgi:hypothetical protein
MRSVTPLWLHRFPLIHFIAADSDRFHSPSNVTVNEQIAAVEFNRQGTYSAKQPPMTICELTAETQGDPSTANSQNDPLQLGAVSKMIQM